MSTKNPCILLDRDGVINKDYVDYAYDLNKFEILPGVVEGLKSLKEAGFKLVIITNQSGIIKGIYDHKDVFICHNYLQEQCGGIIDDIFYSPYHENWSRSLSRKPGSLMYERAISRFDADISKSWMLGDKQRDLLPARNLGLHTILVGDADTPLESDIHCPDLLTASKHILANS